ncbi:MAG: isoprenylcysteine carboxylmethyltransferase family protein [Chloroflexi bacterium]|nr:isoprenylcysteine carboxylmethyltransferase family protein [Chloroflexota bacterium]
MSRIAVIFLVVVAPLLALLLAWLGFLSIATNLVGWFLLLVGVVYSGGVLIAFSFRRERILGPSAGSSYAKEERGDRSFWFIALGMMAVFYLSPLEYVYFGAQSQAVNWGELGGFTLILLGIALFVWAHRTLGTGYTGHASVKAEQTLVQTGPYRFVRHPAYLGYLLMALGIALGYWSLAGLVAVLVFLLPSLAFRITVEEKMLAAHFGKEHEDYSKITKRLIPGIW